MDHIVGPSGLAGPSGARRPRSSSATNSSSAVALARTVPQQSNGLLAPPRLAGAFDDEVEIGVQYASPQADSDEHDALGGSQDSAPTSLSSAAFSSSVLATLSPCPPDALDSANALNMSRYSLLWHGSSMPDQDEAQVPLLQPSACVPSYGATTFPTSPRHARRASNMSARSAPPICSTTHSDPCTSAEQARASRHVVLVFAAIFCVCFMTSLEANTAYLYYNWGLSDFGALASFSTVSIAQQMVYAVIKPPVAILSDVFGRSHALACALVLYGVGYALVAAAHSFAWFFTGIVVQSAGTTGIQVLQSILVADMTSPRYRGLVLGAINMPYLINFALAGPLANTVVRYASWRVGIGMYAVLVPLAGLPLLVILATSHAQTPDNDVSPDSPTSYSSSPSTTFRSKCQQFVALIDFVGYALFALGWLLVLVPMTLRDQLTLHQNLRYALAGLVVLIICGWWQTRTLTPLVPWRVLHNKHVVAACVVGLVDFASFTLSWTYLSAFVQIVKDWNQTRTAYFSTTQTIAMTLMGLVVGWLMSATHKFRSLLLSGVLVRLLGVALMVRFRNAHDPTVLWVLCQVLQGVGGGAVAITMQVGAQVCATPSDVATVTAFQLLVTEVGACFGSAAAGLITSSRLPGLLDQTLPQLDPTERRKIYGSLSTALSYPLGSAERNGIIVAWATVMRYLCLAAFAVLLPAWGFAWYMPDATLRHHHHDHAEEDHPHGHVRPVPVPMNGGVHRPSVASDPVPRPRTRAKSSTYLPAPRVL